jgi:tryptophanyl-tRNA synthetase
MKRENMNKDQIDLRQKIEKLLNSAGVKYEFIPLPKDLASDIASHAKFHGIRLANAMATIIYRTEKGLIGAVKRADTQISQEKLKQLTGVKQLVFASGKELANLGTEVGLVPYVGLDIPYFVDAKVLEIDKGYGITGDRLMGMAMNTRDMLKVNHGKVGDFTYFERIINISEKRHRILSGITPSGDGTLHIGNYLGAVKQFIQFAKTHECFLMVADLHALTTVQNREQLQKNVETLILNELALLGDLTNITFFRQSDVPMHAELQSILNNVVPLGLLKRAHAYKDKLQKEMREEDINLGLFNYPILMAADILLYKPDAVPVGRDQKQHIEITRDIAERFNKIFKSQVFPLPDPYIPEEVAVVLGTDGKRKMSKSLGNIISIFEDEETIKRQVMSTYTDPTRIHADSLGHIEGNMVFAYLRYFADQIGSYKGKKMEDAYKELEADYRDGRVSDVAVKEELFKALKTKFFPARERYQELKNNPETVKKILEEGAMKAREVAGTTMMEVREGVGLTNSYSFFEY